MRVLIIEDDTFFQKFYSSKLIENGFSVDIASDGEEGLTKVQQTRPDIILLDIIMPKKDGFEVLKNLSENKELSSIPVLVFSTLGQEQDVAKAKALGASGYINKSFLHFEDLLSKITLLAQKRST